MEQKKHKQLREYENYLHSPSAEFVAYSAILILFLHFYQKLLSRDFSTSDWKPTTT